VKTVKHIPDGYNSITPYLIIKNAAKAIEFYKKAFGATEVFRMDDAQGRVGHAELLIGDSHLMLADEHPEMGYSSATTIGATPVSLHLYVEDCDGVVKHAVAAGAKLERPVEDRFYGDRNGTIHDPFGHVWTVATHVEDVSSEEMEVRAKKAFKAA
jgi:PhnB protein